MPKAISGPSVPLRPEKVQMAIRLRLEAADKKGNLTLAGKAMLDKLRRLVN